MPVEHAQVGIGKEFRSQENALKEPWRHGNLSRILLYAICAKIENEVTKAIQQQIKMSKPKVRAPAI